MLHFRPDTQRASDADTARFQQALLSGGDHRLALDVRTGRNLYHVPPRPDLAETWLSSSTASPITERGYRAAARAFARWDQGAAASATCWAETVRERLLDLFGIAGAQVILCPSGTDAELLVLAVAIDRLGPAITNIVLAPGETGRGVPLAAGGRHVSAAPPAGGGRLCGSPVHGFSADIEIEAVEIRSADGAALPSDQIDGAVHASATAALRRGRGAIVHCLDVSKTGLSAYPNQALAALADHADRCLVVIDACQLRSPQSRLRDALSAGHVVVITGSKFAGGPPFAGAVLLPPGLAERLPYMALPDGIADYSARTDWPSIAHPALRHTLASQANPGLLLRWEAALSELEPYFAFPQPLRDDLVEAFRHAVTRRVTAARGCRVLHAEEEDRGRCPTIVPIVTTDYRGRAIAGTIIQEGLAAGSRHGGSGSFRVGQAVRVGGEDAVRVCLSAPLLSAMAARVLAGETLDQAIRPFDVVLDQLFEKWARVRSRAAGATLVPVHG